MPVREVTPATLQAALDEAAAGDVIRLAPGTYASVYRLEEKRGTAEAPIVIEAAGTANGAQAIFSAGVSAEDFRPYGNRLAKETQDRDDYPGLYRWIHEARLVLWRCEHVVVRHLAFERSWPTHLFLDDCRAVAVEGCRFTDATFCIGAVGEATADITIDGCSWVQDPVPDRLWREIPWYRVHGAPPDHPAVDVVEDWRLFDGDFFRSVDIRGGVTIRNCRIENAFNAIHGFNFGERSDLNRDFHVHGCRFRQIRDNVLEPEGMAYNWSFHHNLILDCHKWFSFQMARHRFLYVFANCGAFLTIQGPDASDTNRGGGIFKLLKRARAPFGPAYVVHNSVVSRSDYLRKGVFAGLTHANNAIRFAPLAGEDFDTLPWMFGDPDRPARRGRFVTDWEAFAIGFDGDVVRHRDWPDGVRTAGYPVGPASRCEDPGFVGEGEALAEAAGFATAPGSPCRDTALALDIRTPAGLWTAPAGADVGAVQGDAEDGRVALFDGPPFVPTL